VHGKDHNCTKSVLTALQGLKLEDLSSIDSEFGDVERWFQSISRIELLIQMYLSRAAVNIIMLGFEQSKYIGVNAEFQGV
jgi:hypothetical protein